MIFVVYPLIEDPENSEQVEEVEVHEASFFGVYQELNGVEIWVDDFETLNAAERYITRRKLMH